jgi:hypothetical protein
MSGSAATHENYSETDYLAIVGAIPKLFREDASAITLSDYNQYGIWFARQLDYIKTKVYERLYPAMNANRLVPDATDVPEWAETVTVRAFTNVGMAKVISNYADDLPRADVMGSQRTVIVKTIGDSYGYNVNELRASKATGVGLDARKAEAARRAMDLKIATIKLRGDPDYGLFGIFNHPNITEFIFPAPGDWATLTGDQIYTNLNAWIAAYKTSTLGVHTANYLALAPKAWQAAQTKFVTASPGLPVTPLQLFSSQNPNITIEEIWECKAADIATGKDVGLLYELSADNLSHEYVMPFTQLPPEARNLEIVVDCLARTGGVQVYYPLSLSKAMTT